MFDGYDRGVATPDNDNINVEIKRIFALNIFHSYTEL